MSDDVLGPAAQARIRTRIEEGAPLSEFDRRLYERAILRRHAWALALVNTRYTPPSSRTANAVNHGETFLQALADVGASFRRRLWSKPGVGTRVYIGSDGYVSIGQDGTLREVSRGVVTFDPRSLFLYQRAKYREAVALYLQRLREGASSGRVSGFDLFDGDAEEGPTRLHEENLRPTLGPSYTHPASRLLRSGEVFPLLRVPTVFHFIKSRAWAVEVKDDVDPHKVGASFRKALLGKRSLTSADPFLHDMTLHVIGAKEIAVYPAPPKKGAAGGQVAAGIRFHHSPGAFGDTYREPRGTLELHVDGVYAGEAGFLRYPDRTDIFSLEHVILEPAFQKRRLGKLLVARVKKYANERAPAVKYVSGDLASRASLHMMISVLGPPLMIDNSIRCVSIAEAERILPTVSRTKTGPNRRTVIDSGAPIHAIFWIGRGRRPAKSPFPCD